MHVSENYPFEPAKLQRVNERVCHGGDTGLVRQLIIEACFDRIGISCEVQHEHEVDHTYLRDELTFKVLYDTDGINEDLTIGWNGRREGRLGWNATSQRFCERNMEG